MCCECCHPNTDRFAARDTRYFVLSWDDLYSLKQYRRTGWIECPEKAWARAAELWRNPRVRLALVVAVPPKPKKALEDMIREEATMPARFTIPRWLTGNEKPMEESATAAWSRP